MESSPKDSLYSLQYALKQINAEKAWKKATGKGIIIANVDTGIDFENGEFTNQLYFNPAEDINHNEIFDAWLSGEKRNGISGDINGIDDDGDGYIDNVCGYDFVNESTLNYGDSQIRDAFPFDENGHGTCTASVMAARMDGAKGIVGLAFDSKIMPIRVFDFNGEGEDKDISAGIVYAALHGAKVINCSFGDVYYSPLMRDAIKYAQYQGCIIVASSGNNGWSYPHYPSDYDGVISVGASDENGLRYDFSNYGSRLALLAPGVNVLSSVLNNQYAYKSGTSLSAPYVSAASALLLELNPNLNCDDIKGILQSTTKDIAEKGWDEKTGSGILDVGAAVNAIGTTRTILKFIPDKLTFYKDSIKSIQIYSSALSPLFKSQKIQIRMQGEKVWTDLSEEVNTQTNDKLIKDFDIQSYKNGIYEIRLLVNLINSKTLEERKTIEITSSQFKATLNSQAVQIWKSGKRAILLKIYSNFRSKITCQIGDKNIYKSDQDYFTQNHSILLENLSDGAINNIKILAYNSNEELVLQDTLNSSIIFKNESAPENTFERLNYSLPPLFICNQAKDFYKDGKLCFAGNDLSSGDWGKTKIFKFDKDKFTAVDSNNVIGWLPRGLGESNGDGIKEVLTQWSSNTRIYQADLTTGNPFSNVKYQNGAYETAAGFADIDNDGKDEIIANTPSGFSLIKNVNNQYQNIATAENTSGGKNEYDAPSFASGDFDGDGINELAYADNDNDLMIFKYANSKFELQQTISSSGVRATPFVKTIDMDGDGRNEIFYGFHTEPLDYEIRENLPYYWTFRVLRFNSTSNKYQIVWEDNFADIRPGSSYSNGVSIGNLESKSVDEIALSIFPNLYIFNVYGSKTQMLFHAEANSNSSVIADFNHDGINELGYNRGDSTIFIQYKPIIDKPLPLKNIKLVQNDTNTVSLTWNKNTSYENYKISFGELIGDKLTNITTYVCTDTLYQIKNLQNNKYYGAYVQSFIPNIPTIESDLSDFAYIFLHSPVKLLSAKALNRNSIEYFFSNKISDIVEPKYFSAIINSDTIKGATATLNGESSAIVFFPNELPNGEIKLIISPFKDFYGLETEYIESSLLIDFPAENKYINISKATLAESNRIEITYSDKVDASAVNSNNYSFSFDATINKILALNDSSVAISFESHELLAPIGKFYTICAESVTALSGASLDSNIQNCASFSINAKDIDKSYIYPNPVKLSEKETIFFANLADDALVIIYNYDGSEINRITGAQAGGLEWDLRDYKGERINPGVYFFKVKSNNKESILIKFAILP